MNMRFKNIVIMGDIIRPWKNGDQSTSGAFRNIQWLCHMISNAIKPTGIPVFALDWNRHAFNIKYIRFDVAAYYQKKGFDISINNWSTLANNSNYCPDLINFLPDQLEQSLVIGYEMSQMQIATLEKLGVSYIDLVLHPVRFAKDILHGARTNDHLIHQVLTLCHFDSASIYSSASDLMAKICRIPKTVKTPVDTAIILGQVWTDRAVSKQEGGFFKLENFMHKISKIVEKHSCVLYKPHPYEYVSGDKSHIPDAFKSIVSTDLNYYLLISQPTISSVYGLNSSGLYEAKYFERNFEYFIKPQYVFNDDTNGSDIKIKEFITLSEVWTKPDFWNAIISSKNIDFSISKDIMTHNKLRGSMNTDWGYDKIDKLVVQL